ncbi:helix-turn-helix transcriptional regulator [Candidatus Bathyarchaeota archaeon]|nr:helix-turn-helix transcriptional regulator [Candidatus Bathyarchaeota archaeon]MBS7631459.1 helix-turn-helix transcriptional regulator [Candidatus Bathyarchaeota archaeon]
MLKLDEEKKRFLEAIGNPSRLKILPVLQKSKLTVYKICQRTEIERSAMSCNLRSLTEVGLFFRRIYREIPLYTINVSDRRVKALIEFFSKASTYNFLNRKTKWLQIKPSALSKSRQCDFDKP